MNNPEIVSLAKLIASGVITDPRLWGLVVALFLANLVVKHYLPALVTERAKIDAIAANFDKVLDQLGETTRTAKSIEFSLAHRDWTTREYLTLRRTKLEELVLIVVGTERWVETMMLADEMPEDSPIDKFSCISQLYFPELRTLSGDFQQAYFETLMACMDGRSKVREVDFQSAINKVMLEATLSGNDPDKQERASSLLRDCQENIVRRSAVLAENRKKSVPAYENFNLSSKAFKAEATKLMISTINVAEPGV